MEPGLKQKGLAARPYSALLCHCASRADGCLSRLRDRHRLVLLVSSAGRDYCQVLGYAQQVLNLFLASVSTSSVEIDTAPAQHCLCQSNFLWENESCKPNIASAVGRRSLASF